MGLGRKVVWAFALGFRVAQAGSTAQLTVLVYNYADAPETKLAEAEAFAARSYRAAAIDTKWLECATSQDGSRRFQACEQVTDKHRLFLNLVSERMGAEISPGRGSGDTLGTALVLQAFVIYPRVCKMASLWGVPDYVILGSTIAHELGHLLLGPNSHSTSGIMRGSFHRRDLQLESGQFLFDPKQAAQIRKLLGQESNLH